MAVASLVLGIISLVFMFIPGVSFVGIAAGVVAVILGALAMKQLKAAGQPTGMATAGLVMGIVGLAIATIVTIVCGAAICAAGNVIGGLSDFNW
ncbi:MAG: DUF4190 domain-containing protein [Oscillospiraceae bacterium]|nr:DUF4190 domain-containing protein [Oscillospiraceae bacterium]